MYNPVFFLVPNLIGYLRVLLYFVAFIMHTLGRWQFSIILYIIGFLLDELDGLAAKKLNQSTQFGAFLDMVIDRCATTGLCLILSQIYPKYLIVFIGLIILDISSHFYVLAITGVMSLSSHKSIEQWSDNKLLSLYYQQKPFFDLLILGNELFYILLYVAAYSIGLQINWIGFQFSLWQGLLLTVFPLYVLKQIINILQLFSAANQIASVDWQLRNKEEVD